jgi:hypothetical protein
MSGTDVNRHAQEYVDRVLDAQRQSGHEPHLSPEAYAAAIKGAAEGFAGLIDRNERADDDRVPA